MLTLSAKMSHLSHISVKGLMTIGAFTPDDGAVVRACFRRLRDLRERIQSAKHRERVDGLSFDGNDLGFRDGH